MKKIIYFFAILLVLIIFIAFYIGKDKANSILKGDEIDDKITIGEKINIGGGIEAEIVESTISTSTLNKLNLATLDKEIVQSENSIPEIFNKNKETIEKLVSSLKDDPSVFSDWMDLGLYRKTIGDYTGTRDAWLNANILNPNSALPLSNLGNLYGYYLKDSVKAEEYYLASIEAEPSSGFWYHQTYLFYKEALQDMAKAKGILEDGVKNNPNDEELKNILNSL